MDVPYASLLNRRTPFTNRQALPENAGVYAWWALEDTTASTANLNASSARPLYLGATTNIAASVTADAIGIRTTELRKRLAPVLADHLGFRPRMGSERHPRPLNKSEHIRMNHWIGTQLLISWSELPHSADYLDALIRALDPQLKP